MVLHVHLNKITTIILIRVCLLYHWDCPCSNPLNFVEKLSFHIIKAVICLRLLCEPLVQPFNGDVFYHRWRHSQLVTTGCIRIWIWRAWHWHPRKWNRSSIPLTTTTCNSITISVTVTVTISIIGIGIPESETAPLPWPCLPPPALPCIPPWSK